MDQKLEEYFKRVILKRINNNINAKRNNVDKLEANASQASAKYDVIIDRPVHDTGIVWYKVLGFFLPIIGLIIALIFKKHNYLRNYNALKRGAIAGLLTIAAIIALFGIALVLALL